MTSEDLVLAGQGRLTYAGHNHPPVARSKIGILIGNLGTPDATDYWSMRRYLSEFLSDRRVIDYSPIIWQPLLQRVDCAILNYLLVTLQKLYWRNKNQQFQSQQLRLRICRKILFDNQLNNEDAF